MKDRAAGQRAAVERARRLLAEGRRAEAIRLYEAHLERDDDDDEARLEYGIACLVNGDRDRFIEVGMEYSPCMSPATLARLGGRVRALWAEYAEACVRVAAGAALGASIVAACGTSGCGGKTAADAAGKPDAAVVVPAAPAPDTAPPPPSPAEVPAADATGPAPAQDPGEAADGGDGASAASKPPAKPSGKPGDDPAPKPPVIKTRYVAVHFDDENPF